MNRQPRPVWAAIGLRQARAVRELIHIASPLKIWGQVMADRPLDGCFGVGIARTGWYCQAIKIQHHPIVAPTGFTKQPQLSLALDFAGL